MIRTVTASIALLALAVNADAADRHVPLAYPTIQAAIDASVNGDVVIVADGTYVGPGNVDIDFGGRDITVRSANGAERCIINCQATPEDPYRGFIFQSGESRDAILDGFTITQGATLPGAVNDIFNGAGILCNNGSEPTIRNCILTECHAGCWGGAICCTNASPLIENCVITDNIVDDDGGAVFAWAGSHPVMINCVMARNTSVVTGGGFTLFDTGATMINCTIVDNSAQFGAGIYAWNLTMTNCIVYGNQGDVQINGGAQTTVQYSLVEGGHEGDGNIDIDPGFVDYVGGDYHLDIGSACIDAGHPDMPIDPDATDFEGDPRFIAGLIDIGADERYTQGDVDRDGTVGIDDFLAAIASWGPCKLDCVADVNADGFVDVGDILIILANWS